MASHPAAPRSLPKPVKKKARRTHSSAAPTARGKGLDALAAEVVDGRAPRDQRQPRRQRRSRWVVGTQQAEVVSDEPNEDVLRDVLSIFSTPSRNQRSSRRRMDDAREALDERPPGAPVAPQTCIEVQGHPPP